MPFITLTPTRSTEKNLRVFIDPLTGVGIDAIWSQQNSLPGPRGEERYHTNVKVGTIIFYVAETIDQIERLVEDARADLYPVRTVSLDVPDEYRA